MLNENGEEVQLSTLCNEEEPSVYANRAAEAALDDDLRRHPDEDEEEELRKAFLIEDENGDAIEGEYDDTDDMFDGDVYEDEFADDYDDDNN